MTMSVKIAVCLWTPDSRFPLADGKTLVLKGAVQTEFELNVEFTPNLDSPNEPTYDTVVRTTCRFADNVGDEWGLQVFWSTAILTDAMLSAALPFASKEWRTRSKEFQEAFDANVLLSGLKFGSDSREGHCLAIGDRAVDIVFHHTSIEYDLAIIPDGDESCPMPELVARTVPLGTTLYDHETSEELPQLVFPLAWSQLLSTNLVFDADTGVWGRSDFPAPCSIFPTGQRRQPQESVVVV